MNWIDLAIIALVLYFVVKGIELGVFSVITNFIAFAASLILSLRLNAAVSAFFTNTFGIAAPWASVVAYVAVAFITETIIAEILSHFVNRLPHKLLASKHTQVLGGIFSGANALIFVSFFLIVLSVLPVRGTLKRDMNESFIAPKLLGVVRSHAPRLNQEVEEQAKALSKFLTIHPTSRERVPLTIDSPATLTIDDASEREMLALVNKARADQSLPPLVFDAKMRAVARAYSRTMFEGKFFSHVDSEGNDVGDRLEQGGVTFTVAGENLAYAPDVDVAHDGLMNSEGHRRNILDPTFSRVGIGVVDGGIWGKMFTQVFAD